MANNISGSTLINYLPKVQNTLSERYQVSPPLKRSLIVLSLPCIIYWSNNNVSNIAVILIFILKQECVQSF